MKKGITILLICIVFIVVLFISITTLMYNKRIKQIGRDLEINIDNCKLERESDSHGGFLGDGEYFAKITCSKIDYDKLSSNWRVLPLSETIDEVMNIKSCNNDSCMNPYQRYSIPNIEFGYFYFIDRHSESSNKFDDTDLNNRSSWNFTLALLDKDTNTIYFYKLDT